MNNPAELKNAIYGDLLHGMNTDPTWSEMKNEFKQNYTSEELKRISSKQSWWSDANGGMNNNATHDAYIRGFLNEPDVAMKGHITSGGTMYSPKQLQILETMRKYIKTGK
jgi:phage pi2 protein 07